jgi:hypothetical protein
MISRHSLLNTELLLSERRLSTAMQRFEFDRFERLNIRRGTEPPDRNSARRTFGSLWRASAVMLDSGTAALTVI